MISSRSLVGPVGSPVGISVSDGIVGGLGEGARCNLGVESFLESFVDLGVLGVEGTEEESFLSFFFRFDLRADCRPLSMIVGGSCSSLLVNSYFRVSQIISLYNVTYTT